MKLGSDGPTTVEQEIVIFLCLIALMVLVLVLVGYLPR